MTTVEIMNWIRAFASCAIEDNKLAREMLDLWNNGQEEEFVRRLETEWKIHV